MSRPIKAGLDYFPLDANFFNAPDIRPLRRRYKMAGCSIYLYLLCEIYGGAGYYVPYNEDLKLQIVDDLGVTEQKTEQVLTFLSGSGLLSRIDAPGAAKLAPATVLTSPGIQRRFQTATKERFRKTGRPVQVDGRFWLLDGSETADHIKVYADGIIPRKNTYYSAEKIDYSAENVPKVKKSKVKERRDNIEPAAPAALPIMTRADYIKSLAPRNFTEATVEAVVKYIVDRDNVERRQIDDGRIKGYYTRLGNLAADPAAQVAIVEQALRRRWKGFFPLESRPAAGGSAPARHPAGAFANFDQRQYDYDALERALLDAQPVVDWADTVNALYAEDMSRAERDSIDWNQTTAAEDGMIHYLDGRRVPVEEWKDGHPVADITMLYG